MAESYGVWEIDDGLTPQERECDDIGHLSVRYEYGSDDQADDPTAAWCEHCGREVFADEW